MAARKPAKKKKKKERSIAGRIFTTILTVFLIIFMVGLVTGGSIALTVFSDLGLIPIGRKSLSDEIAGIDYMDLNVYTANQQKTSIVYAYDENGRLVEDTRLHGSENRQPISLDEVNEYVKVAVIALEDKRFYDHQGVDWVRTVGVMVYDLMGKDGETQGGSTITQQLIKNLTGENQVTFIRKYREIRNALALERHFSKDEILEAYLNTIYLDMGCYGLKTGADYYFHKKPADLTLMESCMLVSITNAPRKYNPIENYENNRTRAKMCLRYLLEQGKISQADYDAALAEKVKLYGYAQIDSSTDEPPEETEEQYQGYYTDYIIKALISDLRATYGMTENEAWAKVYYGGLKIYSAVDARIQSDMDDIFMRVHAGGLSGNPGIQAGMVVMDYEGRICGIGGGLGEKVGNRTLSYATDVPRQAGSSIKPLSVYAPAIDQGVFNWSSYMPNYGITGILGSEPWPTNYGGVKGSPNDLRNLAEAIAPSLNTIPARIVQAVGTDVCYSYLKDHFHFSTLLESDNNYAPLAIGAFGEGVTPLEMTAAYVVFGNGGTYYKPWCYYKVEDSDGNIILEPDRTGERALSAAAADVTNKLMQGVMTRSDGTGVPYKVPGFTMFGKTGTSSSLNDRWTVGGSAYYVGVVWVGYKYKHAISGNPCGPLFKEVMTRVHEGLENKDFEMSGDAVQRTFCARTGMIASSSCGARGTGWYTIDNIPGVCTVCATGRGMTNIYGSSGIVTKRDDEEKTTKKNEEKTTAGSEEPVEGTTRGGGTPVVEPTTVKPPSGGETPTTPSGGETPTTPSGGGETPTTPSGGGETPTTPSGGGGGGETPTTPSGGGSPGGGSSTGGEENLVG
ncbi:MAG: transglycosylase domain-containing protein [Clostridia bacterium]|nr:transglycosylase domain-containing protein [Clostridia bacterium]